MWIFWFSAIDESGRKLSDPEIQRPPVSYLSFAASGNSMSRTLTPAATEQIVRLSKDVAAMLVSESGPDSTPWRVWADEVWATLGPEIVAFGSDADAAHELFLEH